MYIPLSRNLTFLPLQDDFNAIDIRPNNLDPLLSIGKKSNLAIGNSRRIALNVSRSLHDEWCRNTTLELAWERSRRHGSRNATTLSAVKIFRSLILWSQGRMRAKRVHEYVVQGCESDGEEGC